jgi:hypothetical protein
MRRTLVGTVLVFLLFECFFLAAASSQVSAGVQSGDWIEYNVTSTGAPMQGHDVQSARMKITTVQASNITVEITSNFTDETSDTITSTLNLETGHLIDDFIIPAGLNVGDSFPDENYGNITITGSEVRTYAGAQRTVLMATMGNSSYVWDQETGVSVEGNTTTADYSIYSVVYATNMWQPTPTQAQGTELTSNIMVVVGVLIIVVLISVGAVVHSRRKKPVHTHTPVNPDPC